MRRLLLILAGLMLLVLAPNLIWLSRSTSRLTSASGATLYDVTVLVNDHRVEVGTLKPGERHLILLPRSGDATYRVTYTVDGVPTASPCQEYVEGSMFHVETVLIGGNGDRYVSTLPDLSDLFVLKLVP